MLTPNFPRFVIYSGQWGNATCCLAKLFVLFVQFWRLKSPAITIGVTAMSFLVVLVSCPRLRTAGNTSGPSCTWYQVHCSHPGKNALRNISKSIWVVACLFHAQRRWAECVLVTVIWLWRHSYCIDIGSIWTGCVCTISCVFPGCFLHSQRFYSVLVICQGSRLIKLQSNVAILLISISSTWVVLVETPLEGHELQVKVADNSLSSGFIWSNTLSFLCLLLNICYFRPPSTPTNRSW